VKNREDLIYELIFSEKNVFNLNVADYIEDIYKYSDFITEIKSVLKKSKVEIVKSDILVDSKTVTWELKVNK